MLVATALLCIARQGGTDPLGSRWTRCLEQATDGGRVELSWNDGRLHIDFYWGYYRHDHIWASSLRTS